MAPITATATSKAQVTIPLGVRDTLGLHEGDRVLFEERDGVVVIRKHPRLGPTWDADVAATLTEWEDDFDDDL